MKKYSIINIIAQIFMLGVNLAISFFLVPYITNTIGVEAYGFVGLANDFVGYAQIITIALNSMASRFITIKIHENKIEEANKYYSSVVLTNTIISAVLAIISIIFITFMQYFINIPEHLLFDVKLLFTLIFSNFIISILTSTFAVATFCTNKLYLTSIKTIISQIIRTCILLGCFILLKPSVYYIGIASVVSTAYLGFCNYRYVKTLTPELKISKKNYSLKCLKELLSSGIWNTLSKLSGVLSTGLDLLISNIFIGSTGMGIISCSKTIPNVILNAIGTITGVFSPELTISYAKKKYDEMKQELFYAIKIMGLFTAVPMVFLLVFGQNFYSLWVPTQDSWLLYKLTLIFIFGLCFCLPIDPLWNIFTVTNKVKNSSIFLIINSILTIITVVILLNIFPSSTARLYIIVSVSTFFTIIRGLIFLPLYGAKCLDFKWNTFYPSIIKTISVILLSAILLLPLKLLLPINSWIVLILMAIITSIIVIILILFITLNKDDRIKLKNAILSLKNKIRRKKYE